MNGDFETALVKHVAPLLRPLGYEYEARLCQEDQLFGFRKRLDNDLQAVIQFQRQSDAAIDRFTVNLIRARASDIQPRLYGGEIDARAARLSYVLWFVHDLSDYPVSDYWWTATDAASRETALLDVAEKIARFGVPWLESAAAPKPWEMPANRADEFDGAVQAMMAPALGQLGYHVERQTLSGNLTYCYFSKAMPDGTYAMIELQAIYSLDPSEFNFDVRLQRRSEGDPLAFCGDEEHWRSVSLAQLVCQARNSTALERLPISEVKALLWRYRDRAELNAQLRDALEQIQRIGIAWVEQAVVES